MYSSGILSVWLYVLALYDAESSYSMRLHVTCLMMTSPDGSLHPSKWTRSPDGGKSDWHGLYEKVHADHQASAWMVGRVTMAEISKASAHPPADFKGIQRPHHFANPKAKSFAISLDPSGKVHFSGGDLYGDHVVVLLGADVPDSHLAELAADGVSYIVSDHAEIDMSVMLEILRAELGIERILLEGGANVNGRMMAAGLVDELSLIVAPALEARRGSDRIIENGEEGLVGRAELSLISCEKLSHGVVHLRYAVSSSEGL